jgi:hypothetical protein
MPASTNLPVINNVLTPTTEYFNNFFTNAPSVTQNVDDAVLGYFQQLTGDKDTGKNLAAAVIYTATQRGIEPMALITEFKKLKPKELNAYLTMFLNFNRAGTSLLGLSNSPQTNKYIQRAILP